MVRRLHPFRAMRRIASALRGENGPSRLDLKAINVAYVEDAKRRMPHDVAMQEIIGSNFERTGLVEAALLKRYGLPPEGYLVDVGCGSGRLAKPLSEQWNGRYLGVDLVPDLIQHARKLVGRANWRFEVIDHIDIPERDGRADLVCFFSVLTHLLHEQSYWYLEEARRVLKPGGRIVLSFLEFAEPAHWRVFMETLEASKGRSSVPLNVFLDRQSLTVWAGHLGMEVEAFHDAGEMVVPEGHLGQSLCVLRKPLAHER